MKVGTAACVRKWFFSVNCLPTEFCMVLYDTLIQLYCIILLLYYSNVNHKQFWLNTILFSKVRNIFLNLYIANYNWKLDLLPTLLIIEHSNVCLYNCIVLLLFYHKKNCIIIHTSIFFFIFPVCLASLELQHAPIWTQCA